MNAVFERRLRRMRARMLVRQWNYKQLRHSRGSWFRLRRALAHAREAFAISADAAQQLLAEGHRVEPVGAELAPPKRIVLVSSARVARIASARPLTVSLNAELLAAECLALVPFVEDSIHVGRQREG